MCILSTSLWMWQWLGFLSPQWASYQLGMFSIVNNRISITGLNKEVYNSYITAVWTKVAAGISLVAQIRARLASLWFPWPFFLVISAGKSDRKGEELCQICFFQKKKKKAFPKASSANFPSVSLAVPGSHGTYCCKRVKEAGEHDFYD